MDALFRITDQNIPLKVMSLLNGKDICSIRGVSRTCKQLFDDKISIYNILKVKNIGVVFCMPYLMKKLRIKHVPLRVMSLSLLSHKDICSIRGVNKSCKELVDRKISFTYPFDAIKKSYEEKINQLYEVKREMNIKVDSGLFNKFLYKANYFNGCSL